MRILVRATNWVGDAIMSIPALSVIRERWPEAEIAVLARDAIADLYSGQPFLNRVIRAGSLTRPMAAERMAKNLRVEQFDCAILLQNAFSAAWLAWRAKIPQRIGYGRDGRGLLLTQSIPVPRTGEIPLHESYYYLELLRRAGWIEKLPVVTHISFQIAREAMERSEARLREAGAQKGRPRIALAPGASYGSAKCWLPERFAAVADALIDEFGADVILFGTTSEIEICKQIAQRMRRRALTLTGQTNMTELPSLFSRCHLFIGNDSGTMHVAAAAGIPVVAVFGSTDPDGTAPMTAKQKLVRHAVSCSPCFLRSCPIDHRCMTRVPVEDVRAAAASFLKELPRG